jgi:hypothetical protein
VRPRVRVAPLLVLLLLAAPAFAYEEVVVTDGGVLAGTVRFRGTPPVLEAASVHKHRDVCGAQSPSEALVLGPDRGVSGSVVMIQGVTRGKRRASDVVLETVACRFSAHVTATAAGTRARVKNSDPMLHNALGLDGRMPIFDVALPSKEQTVDITRRLTRPGTIRVLCDAHPHMAGWMVVHDSPYVAVTNERGAYRIDHVPPGTWKVTMWHEGFRPRGTDASGRRAYDASRTSTRTATITSGATTNLDFELR